MNKVREGYKEYEFGVIPNDWQVKKLGDIFNDLKGGSTPSRLIDRYYTGDIPWITSGELKYKTIYNTLESITEEAVKDTNLKLYPEGTFFIAITGLEAEGTRGSCAITGVPATTNQSCLAFQPKEGFSNLYLYHWYRLYGNYIGLKYTQGTKQQSLNNKIVGKLEIPVPKLEEQEKIASILSTVDEQIDNVDALIEKNKELKKGLMQTLLTKGIGHTKFKTTEIGEIPEEWEVVKFKEITDILRCGVASTPTYVENGIPFLSAQNVNNEKLSLHKYNFISEDYHKQLTKNDKPQKGDILYSRVGANYGIAAVVDIDFEFSVYVSLTLIRMKNEYDSKFYKYLLNSTVIRKQADIGVFQGGGVPNLNVKVVEKFNVVVPPKYEQIKIASILSEVDRKIDEYENKKQKLEELKKGLMQQLLTGMIRVTV